jgi:drug/metabolite transporter superfamily protein YnfA
VDRQWVTTGDQGQFLGGIPMGSFIVEFWSFLRDHKKMWLLPMMLVMALFGMALTQLPVVAPFIYALF